MTQIRIAVTNDSAQGGTFLTPFWFGAHDGTFDLYDRNVAASPGLEALAEDGTFATIDAELIADDANAIAGAITGAGGPIATGEATSTIIDVDALTQGYIDVAAMILPSNDAFVGTGTSIEIFDEEGNFLGAQQLDFNGDNVLDAGTEYNTEEDAAFINQAGPNTGLTENGVVVAHQGFNGSAGNPDGTFNNPDGQPGAQIILGGTNAFGAPITAEAADFTLEGAQIATVHINLVNEETGDGGRDRLLGGDEDDIFSGEGGRDVLRGRDGWDDLSGGAGSDRLFGGRGNDLLDGGAGDDLLQAGFGRDRVEGGTGDDQIFLRRGVDTIVFSEGDGADTVNSFGSRDVIELDVDGIESFADVLEVASGQGRRVEIDFGDGDSLTLTNTSLDDLSESNFLFV